MLFTDSELVCPRGTPGDAPWVIDIKEILKSEKRQDEVATVTKFKASELLAEFNRTWRDIHKLVTQLTSEKNKAKKALENRRAVLLLEIIPAKLELLDVPDTKEYREAVISLDKDATSCKDALEQIEVVIEYFRGKLKSFENAYMSVKKVMGDDGYNMSLKGRNTSLTGDTVDSIRNAVERIGGSPAPAVQKAPVSKPATAGWGKPKY